MNDYPGLVRLLLADPHALQSRQGPFEWNFEAWMRRFAVHPAAARALLELRDEPNDRDSLYRTAAAMPAGDPDAHLVLKLFIGTQVWGYGTIGYGPYRAQRILSQPGAERRLASTLKVLRSEGALAGYMALCEGQYQIRYLGPSFATKYLHFAGYGHVPSGPQPLILDQYVGVALHHAEPALFGADCGSVPSRQHYSRYVSAVDAVTTSGPLSEFEPCAIELALFVVGERLRSGVR